jgi:hypothetical protein
MSLSSILICASIFSVFKPAPEVLVTRRPFFPDASAVLLATIWLFIRYGFDTPKLASALFGFVKSYF